MKLSVLASVLALVLGTATGCGTSTPPPGDGGSDGATLGGDAGACSQGALRPIARDAHTAVLIPASSSILLYGGDTAPVDPMSEVPSIYSDELWRYDVACGSFTRVTPTGSATPGKRGGHAATLDTKRNRMIVYGGRSGDDGAYQLLADTWSLDLATSTWTPLATLVKTPAARQSARIVYDAAKDRVVLFGGNLGKEFGDAVNGETWALDFGADPTGVWSALAVTGPKPRQDMATVLDEKRNQWMLFGGAFSFIQYSAEVWAFDLAADQWTRFTVTGPAPTPRFWSGLVRDVAGDRLVMFGGHDAGAIGLLNDTWTFTTSDGKTGKWDNPIGGDQSLDPSGVDRGSPERRGNTTLVASGSGAWLADGVTDCSPIDDVWTLSFADLMWTNQWKAQQGETCSRRATPSQSCPDDCGNPI